MFAIDGSAIDGSELVEFHHKMNFVDKLISNFTTLEFEFIIAFLGFYIVRFVCPNSILGLDTNMKTGFTLSFFYALLILLRSLLLDYKKDVDKLK